MGDAVGPRLLTGAVTKAAVIGRRWRVYWQPPHDLSSSIAGVDGAWFHWATGTGGGNRVAASLALMAGVEGATEKATQPP